MNSLNLHGVIDVKVERNDLETMEGMKFQSLDVKVTDKHGVITNITLFSHDNKPLELSGDIE